MMRQWRQVLPNKYFLLIFTVLYLLTYSLDWIFIRLGASTPREVALIRVVLLLVASACYGLYRIAYFHPGFNGRYLEWLSLGPWTYGKQFPLGPPHLVLVDLVIVGALSALGYLNGFFPVVLVPGAFLLIYLLLFSLTFDEERGVYIVGALFIVPFVAYPHYNLNIAFMVLVALYALLFVGFRQQFKGFPWNTPYWTGDAVERLRKEFAVPHMVGWLNHMLKRKEKKPIKSFLGAVGIAGLITWWLHVSLWVVGKYENINFASTIVILLGVPGIILLRLVGYFNPGYRAPMSFFGRLFTFRWIIPRYHAVYLAPATMVVALPGILVFGVIARLSLVHVCELVVFAEVLLAISLPPSLQEWRLTGGHRMVEKSKRMQRQNVMTVPLGTKLTQGVLEKVIIATKQ